jgi:hypothetical protein
VITLRPHQREQHVIYHYGSWLSIGCSSFALTLDCSRWLSFRVPLLVGRYAEVHSQRNSADVWRLRLAIPMALLYFYEFFHLGNPFLNDNPHSKPITKANGVVRRQLQAMAADDGRQTWDPPPDRSRNSFFAN